MLVVVFLSGYFFSSGFFSLTISFVCSIRILFDLLTGSSIFSSTTMGSWGIIVWPLARAGFEFPISLLYCEWFMLTKNKGFPFGLLDLKPTVLNTFCFSKYFCDYWSFSLYASIKFSICLLYLKNYMSINNLCFLSVCNLVLSQTVSYIGFQKELGFSLSNCIGGTSNVGGFSKNPLSSWVIC